MSSSGVGAARSWYCRTGPSPPCSDSRDPWPPRSAIGPCCGGRHRVTSWRPCECWTPTRRAASPVVGPTRSASRSSPGPSPRRDVDAAADALVDLHGALPVHRITALAAALGRGGGEAPPARPDGLVLSPDVRETLERGAVAEVAAHHRDHPVDTGAPLGSDPSRPPGCSSGARPPSAGRTPWRRRRPSMPSSRISWRGGGWPGTETGSAIPRSPPVRDRPWPPRWIAWWPCWTYLRRPTSPTPRGPPGVPPDGVRALEASGRIVRVEANLAWAASHVPATGGAGPGPCPPRRRHARRAARRERHEPALRDAAARGPRPAGNPRSGRRPATSLDRGRRGTPEASP